MDRIELGIAPAPEGGILSVVDVKPMPEGLLAFQQEITAPADLAGIPILTEVAVQAYVAEDGPRMALWNGGEKTFSDVLNGKAYAFTAYTGIEASLLEVQGAPDLALAEKIFKAREGRTVEYVLSKILAASNTTLTAATSGLRAIGLGAEAANLIDGDPIIITTAALAVDGARGLKGDGADLRTITGVPVSAQLTDGDINGPYPLYVTPKPVVFRSDLTLIEGPALKSNRTNYLAEATYVIVVDPLNTYSLEATINA